MSKDIRLQALARLAKSASTDAEAALRTELDFASSTIAAQGKASDLIQALEVLEVIGYRFSDQVIVMVTDFLARLDKEPENVVARSAEEDGLPTPWYLSHLATKAIDVALRLRYLQTKAVLSLLLRESEAERDGVRQKVKSGLDSIVAYEGFVFFGDREAGRPGIGPRPQADVLEVFENLEDPGLLAHFDHIRTLAEKILSPTVNFTKWQSDSVQFGFAAVPAIPEVKSVRERAIALLVRLYRASPEVSRKIAAIGGLAAATRPEERGLQDADVVKMLYSNALSVLGFFAEQALAGVPLPVVQAIESRAYQIFRNFDDEKVDVAARVVEAAIAKNEQYQIYRTLIGFEGVFGPWTKGPEGTSGFRGTEELRKKLASEYVLEIGPDNIEAWKARVLEFAKTESIDLATFPVFYHFLREVATHVPILALDLVSSDARQIDKFLIPLLAGLWNGPDRAELKSRTEQWLVDPKLRGRYIFALVKMFLSTNDLDIDLLKRLLKLSIENCDEAGVRQVASVAVSRFEDNPAQLQALFVDSIDALSQMGDASWVFDAWYQPELKLLFGELNRFSIERVLANLLMLPRLDFHAEEVLSVIADLSPDRVFKFLLDRLRHVEFDGSDGGKYEAVPYDFHKLKDSLSGDPAEAVRLSLEFFGENPEKFRFGGASLLQSIFPDFPPEFERELLHLVQGRRPKDLQFVLDVLKNYEGDSRVYELLKAIIEHADGDSDVDSDVTFVLYSTGVVSGEFGFAQAMEARRVAVSEWLKDPRDSVQRFARKFLPMIEKARDAEQARAEESVMLRKHQYRED